MSTIAATVSPCPHSFAMRAADSDHQRIEDEVVTFLESLAARGLLAPETP